LIANDRASFDKILDWTRTNLSSGELGVRLAAWQWGKRTDGSWGVVDENAAADADTWLAYTLFEAGRLWHEPRYTAQASLMLVTIRLHLIGDYSGLGIMLKPAPAGFDLESGGTRLNPSYLPVQVLRAFANHDPNGPWNELIENNFKLLEASSSKGFVPDWVAYVPGQGFLPDPKTGAIGSYDAIRVYLWWGMLAKQDTMSAQLKKILYGMNQLIPKYEVSPPLKADAQTGMVSDIGPPSFSAALLPYLVLMGNKSALRLQKERLIAQQEVAAGGLIGQELRYYDQVLTLFGLGWMEHRFSFSSQGQLLVQWNSSCSVRK
jgi:endoglucanase